MHTYIKHAGLALTAVILAAGLTACKKEEKGQKADASARVIQQQSRSDLKSGFGNGTSDRMDTAHADAPAMDAAKAGSGEAADVMNPALENPSMGDITGSVKPVDGPEGADTDIAPVSADDGNAMAVTADKALSEDERFAAELAKEAEKEETETQAAKKGESR